jgi:hypothetical protein
LEGSSWENLIRFFQILVTPARHHHLTERDPRPTGEVPAYEPSTDFGTVAATTKFSPALNGSCPWNLITTFHLGPTAEEKLYAVSSHASFSNKPSMVVHDNSANEHAVMAMAICGKWGRNRPVAITLASRPGSAHEHDMVESLIPGSLNQVSPTYTFETLAGQMGTARERFESRRGHGNEIKELVGHTHGWKLVLLTGPVTSVDESKNERSHGYTSDG